MYLKLIGPVSQKEKTDDRISYRDVCLLLLVTVLIQECKQ